MECCNRPKTFASNRI